MKHLMDFSTFQSAVKGLGAYGFQCYMKEDWGTEGQVFQLKVAWIFCLRWARMRAVETCGCFLL
jgi:hypothetical protein